MSPALLLLLLALSSLSLPARGEQDPTIDYGDETYEYEYDYTDEPFLNSDYDLGWLTDLLDEIDACDPSPCLNNGSCTTLVTGGYECSCPRPYSGQHCQIFTDPCKNVRCGHGECVLTQTAPYYECKCRPPYKGPNCKKAAPCRPNPCMNGATCKRGQSRTKFECVCPSGYSGKFCQVGPNDCMVGNGESYRGFVSETEDGVDCLPWNSHLIPSSGSDLTDQADGLGPHSYCRNPDGESAPWCFTRIKNKLHWNYCNIRTCSGSMTVQPTVPVILKATAPPSREFPQCGKPEPSRASARVFGEGRPCQPPTRGRLLCSNNMNEMQVELGGINLDKTEDFEQIIAVEKAIIHKDYRESVDALHNDIAVLKLKGPKGQCARESRFVKTACLPTGPLPDATECSISGWGATEKEAYSTQLLSAKVRLISKPRCTTPEVYGDRLDDSMICAGNLQGGVDSCQGDSGGPLVCVINGTHYVYGVVSWGDSCGLKNKPGVYARVNHFIDWIAAKLLAD